MPDFLIPVLSTASILLALGAAGLALASSRLKIEVHPLVDGLELSNRADDGAQAANAEILGIKSLAKVEAALDMLRRSSDRNQRAAALTIVAVALNLIASTLPLIAPD